MQGPAFDSTVRHPSGVIVGRFVVFDFLDSKRRGARANQSTSGLAGDIPLAPIS